MIKKKVGIEFFLLIDVGEYVGLRTKESFIEKKQAPSKTIVDDHFIFKKIALVTVGQRQVNKKPRRQLNSLNKTLMSRKMAVHVRSNSWYISLPSSA